MCALVDGGQTCSLPIVPPGNRECGPPRPAIGQGGRGRLRRRSSCNQRVCATLPCCAQMLLRVMVDERIGDAVASDLGEVDLRIHWSLGFGVGDHLFSACLQTGGASCRERVCHHVKITEVDVALNKKKKKTQ